MARGETPDAENGLREFQRAKMSPQDTQRNTRPILPKIKLNTVKSVLSGHSKKDQKLVFKTDYCLMQVKSIIECSSILQYFRPSLGCHFNFIKIVFFCLFLCGRLSRVCCN